MARWVSISAFAAAIALVVASVQPSAAEEVTDRPLLLHLDGPMVGIKVLAQENLQGRGLPAQGLFSGPVDFGVILWDEVKPGRPAPPSPHMGAAGQGRSNVNGSVR